MQSEKRYCRVPTHTRLNKYQISRMATLALRPTCAPIFLPLFDHCVRLAEDSYRAFVFGGPAYGYSARRAGAALAKARQVAGYAVCKACGAPIVDGTTRCSANGSHVAVRAASEPCWGETIGARCC